MVSGLPDKVSAGAESGAGIRLPGLEVGSRIHESRIRTTLHIDLYLDPYINEPVDTWAFAGLNE
jgi:hypothetical protein